mgnify:FL=1
MSRMEILSSKHKSMQEAEEKVNNLLNSGHLTSGMKGGVQILKTPE